MIGCGLVDEGGMNSQSIFEWSMTRSTHGRMQPYGGGGGGGGFVPLSSSLNLFEPQINE